MTPVRRARSASPADAGEARASKARRAGSKDPAASRQAGGTARPTAAEPAIGTPSATKIAQVRLRPDEMAALEAVVRRLNLTSNSEALREGLRLLIREASELEAAEDIRAYYEGKAVPLPDGVAPVTDAELQAVDEAQW